ncbi:Geranylgeranyl transferase type-1 subunit beta [Cryptotermes secundus]|uniref:Geranylgeranyl transferase type-1 subunit beta n=1 Tax=Cryptotermes secundus TaxID=105785 RepID=A0A2J7PZS2_9NEOP|nr:Geranylgeranyl transferase type-1 subunit beta [Cryptotermes secundus]
MFPCDNSDLSLAKKQHIKYFQRFLNILPARLISYDSTRLTMAFFAISGLDILNALDVLDDKKKEHIIDWIYRLQVVPDGSHSSLKRCGFQGSSTLIFTRGESDCSTVYECGHLAMTYTGLASLVILGDNLSRVNRAAIIEGVKALQQEDGSFCATLAGSESDMRFVYCAACICYILHDWSAMDVKKTVNYITRSMSYDYGIALAPELESHGGTTFCAVATLALMNQLNTCFTNKQVN